MRRKQGRKESVDTYAQELQRLFQRAYPNAVHGNPDAHEMGQAVLSSQFVSGLTPQIKRKIAYLEGATFSELWQKARFEEAHLRDLESATYTDHAPRKYHTSTDDCRQGENPYPKNPPQNRGPPRRPRPGEGNQTIICFKCRQLGHVARNCRQGTRYPEASGRQTAPRTAAVSPDSETVQQAGKGSDVSGKASRWMHGLCHASQGGDPPEQSTFQPLRLGPTPKIPVIVEGIEVEALVDTWLPSNDHI